MGERIWGYQRMLEGRAWVSPDGLWWRGESPDGLSGSGEHCTLDANTGWKDKNNRWVFVQDVVEIHWKNPIRRKWIANIMPSADGIVLSNADGRQATLEELVFAKSFEVVGHTWLT